MKALIIEDEIPAAERLTKLLSSVNPAITILSICDSVEGSVNWLKTNSAPDIIFMDIELTDGRSFEIFNHIDVTSPVVFITSYDEFAIKAIKLNALDYLLKPIDKQELASALQRLEKNQKGNLSKSYSALSQSLNQEKPIKKLAIGDLNEVRFIEIDKIIRLKADSNYTHIYLASGESITSSRTLKEYEDLLINNNFFRVHNTHLINLSYVERYIKGIGGTVIMSDGVSVEVSRKKKKELMDLLSLNH